MLLPVPIHLWCGTLFLPRPLNPRDETANTVEESGMALTPWLSSDSKEQPLLHKLPFVLVAGRTLLRVNIHTRHKPQIGSSCCRRR